MNKKLEDEVGSKNGVRRERCVWFWSTNRDSDAKENSSKCLSCTDEKAELCSEYTEKSRIKVVCKSCRNESSFRFVGEQRENGEDNGNGSKKLFDHYECTVCGHTQAFNVTEYFKEKYEKIGENGK